MSRFVRVLILGMLGGAVALLAACGAPRRPVLHLLSKSYDFTVEPSDIPPRAREHLIYKITVRDRKTQEPIDNGQGQIFANMQEGAQGPHTWDALAPSAEVGTYRANLDFIVAGTWAMAIRFQRDSLHPLERVDWMQDVFNERPDSVP